jgi:hypothetical protein
VEDTGHHVISGQHEVCVERVDDALFGVTVWAGNRNTTLHEETEVVGVNGSGTINHLTCLVVVERLPHVVDIVTEGLSMALSDHQVVQWRQGASKGPTVETFTQDVPRGCCSGDALHRLVSALTRAGCMK